ncbi:hypothetical protein CK240_14245, partial [Paracoccus salipaludis]
MPWRLRDDDAPSMVSQSGRGRRRRGPCGPHPCRGARRLSHVARRPDEHRRRHSRAGGRLQPPCPSFTAPPPRRPSSERPSAASSCAPPRPASGTPSGTPPAGSRTSSPCSRSP